jgi:hypothetical protein
MITDYILKKSIAYVSKPVECGVCRSSVNRKQ